MTPITCTFCGIRNPDGGFLFGSLSLRICRTCRDRTLTYINSLGVDMTEENPFIAELCYESSILEVDWWSYYDSLNQRKGLVIRKKKPKTT